MCVVSSAFAMGHVPAMFDMSNTSNPNEYDPPFASPDTVLGGASKTKRKLDVRARRTKKSQGIVGVRGGDVRGGDARCDDDDARCDDARCDDYVTSARKLYESWCLDGETWSPRLIDDPVAFWNDMDSFVVDLTGENAHANVREQDGTGKPVVSVAQRKSGQNVQRAVNDPPVLPPGLLSLSLGRAQSTVCRPEREEGQTHDEEYWYEYLRRYAMKHEEREEQPSWYTRQPE
jgi:hypothetical protein